ncbi:hypothetical protein Scep_019880 [Stephania cephalantha]|uniref:SBP-type domain-containing protein n=1 Tax=Stephania cephalantha TaxID=152367 RepID=A0AAP0NQ95_9MAGN
MEEVGAQVAHPLFVHQAIPGRFCELPPLAKKRDLSSWQAHGFHHHLQHQVQHQQQQQQHQRLQTPVGNWDSRAWNWDSARFVAKPLESEVLRLGSVSGVGIEESIQKRRGEEGLLKTQTVQNSVGGGVSEDGENLKLKLGGGLAFAATEEPAARPNKRVRSGSPGSANYPMCQVDDCKADLSNAKDYHKRHKVCELHSKTTKALVGKQMQRFCQQCSRFHPLSEFDEGKRSCRRRLAGHNRRRRKTQQEDASSHVQAANVDNTKNGNLDIVNLLTILTRLQSGNDTEKMTTNGTSAPGKDWLVQILKKINPAPVAMNPAMALPVTRGFDLNVSQEASPELPDKLNGDLLAPSTTDLLAALSSAVGSPSPDNLANLSRSSHSSNDDKGKLNCLDLVATSNLLKKPPSGFHSVRGERSCTSFHSPPEVSDCQIQEVRPSLPLQLFTSSSEDGCPSKLGSAVKYVSSDSSNPMEDRSPSSSPPVMKKLFPMQSTSEITKHESASISGGGEDNGTVEISTTHCWGTPLELFKGSTGRAGNNSVQNLPYQAGYTYSSGSDHSPSSSNSDPQDRTGRIIFKLFDKDPSKFPASLRNQILDWLAHCPSEMESYIRPGCVVLSIYISMSSTAWERLQEDLIQRVSSLIHDPGTDFWRSGRFLVQTDTRLASHKDGKIRLSKSWRTWSSPELVSVTPLAIVGGQKTSLSLKGRNLNVPGTKIHCTHMGGYLSKEVLGSAGTVYDEASLECFSFPGGMPNVLGRCFIEVENGFKGNSFPIIIADDAVCKELRQLEPELEEDTGMSDANSEDQTQDLGRPQTREDVLNYLNELGWLFQRKNSVISLDNPDFSHSRAKFLLTFSVERDWCALVKTIVDILVEIYSRNDDGLSKEVFDALLEINLLNRAVKRKCTSMVNMLVHYSLSNTSDGSKNYLFPPNQAGPGFITPLHLAACTHNSEAVVDALTNDPQHIGLKCWTTLMDANGQSPHAYASMRNNHSYNRLVFQKIDDRKHGHLTITVGDGTSLDQSWITEEQAATRSSKHLHREGQQSCAKCAAIAIRCRTKMPGSQGLLHQPYVRSMLAIAAVCVCVCLFLRGAPDIGSVAPFKWENLNFGPS